MRLTHGPHESRFKESELPALGLSLRQAQSRPGRTQKEAARERPGSSSSDVSNDCKCCSCSNYSHVCKCCRESASCLSTLFSPQISGSPGCGRHGKLVSLLRRQNGSRGHIICHGALAEAPRTSSRPSVPADRQELTVCWMQP